MNKATSYSTWTKPRSKAQIDGVLRGLIRPMTVPDSEKVGDVDPSGDRGHCCTISEKARAIGGGVLEAIMHSVLRTGKRVADSSHWSL